MVKREGIIMHLRLLRLSLWLLWVTAIAYAYRDVEWNGDYLLSVHFSVAMTMDISGSGGSGIRLDDNMDDHASKSLSNSSHENAVLASWSNDRRWIVTIDTVTMEQDDIATENDRQQGSVIEFEAIIKASTMEWKLYNDGILWNGTASAHFLIPEGDGRHSRMFLVALWEEYRDSRWFATRRLAHVHPHESVTDVYLRPYTSPEPPKGDHDGTPTAEPFSTEPTGSFGFAGSIFRAFGWTTLIGILVWKAATAALVTVGHLSNNTPVQEVLQPADRHRESIVDYVSDSQTCEGSEVASRDDSNEDEEDEGGDHDSNNDVQSTDGEGDGNEEYEQPSTSNDDNADSPLKSSTANDCCRDSDNESSSDDDDAWSPPTIQRQADFILHTEGDHHFFQSPRALHTLTHPPPVLPGPRANQAHSDYDQANPATWNRPHGEPATLGFAHLGLPLPAGLATTDFSPLLLPNASFHHDATSPSSPMDTSTAGASHLWTEQKCNDSPPGSDHTTKMSSSPHLSPCPTNLDPSSQSPDGDSNNLYTEGDRLNDSLSSSPSHAADAEEQAATVEAAQESDVSMDIETTDNLLESGDSASMSQTSTPTEMHPHGRLDVDDSPSILESRVGGADAITGTAEPELTTKADAATDEVLDELRGDCDSASPSRTSSEVESLFARDVDSSLSNKGSDGVDAVAKKTDTPPIDGLAPGDETTPSLPGATSNAAPEVEANTGDNGSSMSHDQSVPPGTIAKLNNDDPTCATARPVDEATPMFDPSPKPDVVVEDALATDSFVARNDTQGCILPECLIEDKVPGTGHAVGQDCVDDSIVSPEAPLDTAAVTPTGEAPATTKLDDCIPLTPQQREASNSVTIASNSHGAVEAIEATSERHLMSPNKLDFACPTTDPSPENPIEPLSVEVEVSAEKDHEDCTMPPSPGAVKATQFDCTHNDDLATTILEPPNPPSETVDAGIMNEEGSTLLAEHGTAEERGIAEASEILKSIKNTTPDVERRLQSGCAINETVKQQENLSHNRICALCDVASMEKERTSAGSPDFSYVSTLPPDSDCSDDDQASESLSFSSKAATWHGNPHSSRRRQSRDVQILSPHVNHRRRDKNGATFSKNAVDSTSSNPSLAASMLDAPTTTAGGAGVSAARGGLELDVQCTMDAIRPYIPRSAKDFTLAVMTSRNGTPPMPDVETMEEPRLDSLQNPLPLALLDGSYHQPNDNPDIEAHNAIGQDGDSLGLLAEQHVAKARDVVEYLGTRRFVPDDAIPEMVLSQSALAAIEAINAPCWEFDERVLDSKPSTQPKRAKRSRRRQSSHAETSRGETTQRIRPDTVTSKEAKVGVRTVKPEAAAGTTSAAPTDSSNVRRSGRLKKGTDADASAPNPRPSKRQKVKGKP